MSGQGARSRHRIELIRPVCFCVIAAVKSVLQTAIELPDPLAARRRGAERRIVEDNVHRRNVIALSRIKAAIRADHVFHLTLARRVKAGISRNTHQLLIDREIVGHARIELLSARRQILPPVEVVVSVDIAARNPGFDLGLNRAVAPGRTEARGLDRAVLCDQRSAAQVLIRTVRYIAPREFRAPLPHLRDVVGIPLTVMFRNARPVTGSAGPRCGIHLLRIRRRALVRVRHDDVKRNTVALEAVVGIQRDAGFRAIRIFSADVIAA